MHRSPPSREVRAGIERLPARHDLPRHQHCDAYVTVVFAGAYEQAAYAGRLQIGPGAVILQPTFDCHADRMLSPGVELLRLPWRRETGLGGVFHDCPVDEIRRAAEDNLADAVSLVSDLLARRRPEPPRLADWCDALAAALARDPTLRIAAWAAESGLSREAVSRGFRARYGVSPARFRGEVRARAAWARIATQDAPLTAVSHDLGFSDQAHMTRAVTALTGRSPTYWRPSRSDRAAALGADLDLKARFGQTPGLPLLDGR